MDNIAKVLNAKIGQEVLISHYYIKTVKFESWEHWTDPQICLTPYSWVAKSTSIYKHRPEFPMKNRNYVKFFKTLIGAKRNFIRKYLKEKKEVS